MWRSGYFAFHISTSLSTIPLLPPLRSHITRSAAKPGADIATMADADRPKNRDRNVLESVIGFLPSKTLPTAKRFFLCFSYPLDLKAQLPLPPLGLRDEKPARSKEFGK